MNIIALLTDNPVFSVSTALFGVLAGLELLSRLGDGTVKRGSLLVLSVALLAWMDPGSCLLLAICATAVYLVARCRVPIKRFLYPLVALCIGLLLVIKDTGVFGPGHGAPALGVSYYFFRLIAFLIEYARKPEEMSRVSPLRFFSWIVFFPVLVAGPILRFQEFGALDPEAHRRNKPAMYRRLLVGVCLKILVVDMVLFKLAYAELLPRLRLVFHAADGSGLCCVFVLFSFAAFLHAYLDLLSYTEMSIAVANILGFTNVENFNRPLLASNISQFWQRWHMSLSNWTRDYVFFPALVKTKKPWLCTYASLLTIGLWHALSPAWILWALIHATAINLYGVWRKTGLFRRLAAVPAGGRILTVGGVVVTVTFVALVFSLVAGQEPSFILAVVGRIAADALPRF